MGAATLSQSRVTIKCGTVGMELAAHQFLLDGPSELSRDWDIWGSLSHRLSKDVDNAGDHQFATKEMMRKQ